MLLSRAALVAALFAPTSANAQDAGSEASSTRWYDVRAALAAGAETPPRVDLRTHLASAEIDALRPSDHDVVLGPDHGLVAEDLVGAVRAAAAASGAGLDGVRSEAGFVVVSGDAAAQRAAAGVLDALGAALLDRVAVEVFRVDDAALPPDVAPLLGPEAAAALVEGLAPVDVARCDALLGRPTALGSTDVRAFLYDYDVEVASGAVAADPVVSALRTGLEVGVRIDRAVDGRRLVARVWGRDGAAVDPMRVAELVGLGGARIELPRVATSLWTASALVEPGGALVIDHDGGGRSALVVRIAPGGAPPRPESFLPLGELALRPMRPDLARVAITEPSGGWGAEAGAGSADAMASWLDGSVPSDVLEESLEGVLESGSALRLGSGLVVTSADALSSDWLRAATEAARDVAVGTAAVEVRYGLVPNDGAGELRSPGGLAAFAESAGPRLVGSVLEGDALLLVGGEESAYLQDHDSQIAGGSTIPDPSVAHTFEGIALWCAPLRAPGGAWSAWFDVQLHAPAPEARRVDVVQFRPNADRGSGPQPIAAGRFLRDLAVELPTTRRVRARASVRAEDDAWALVALRPVPGTEETLVVAARMNRR